MLSILAAFLEHLALMIFAAKYKAIMSVMAWHSRLYIVMTVQYRAVPVKRLATMAGQNM